MANRKHNTVKNEKRDPMDVKMADPNYQQAGNGTVSQHRVSPAKELYHEYFAPLPDDPKEKLPF